ncbi:unnamed protein product [Didymodactylos carnosus]|uniref:Endonuclease/exonuclease/phosphatase domain-containing protein n=1 Tax=Didymodactylos carnosus TaxID=1234261 RepID=A0A816BFN0_9BILA|nr:unnamed protein product [Didymodactylos carnosus]CAF1608601.1 unnamed protein product [Didymodactylos carnosus]CAF4351978.1 unnamed protein product [Didymodactylos carnosus]CAF4490175.1 unnamed protein product [Didymodactylos carnosus]
MNRSNLQFNVYKYYDLEKQILPVLNARSKFQKELGLRVIVDLCWTRPLEDVAKEWLDNYKEPQVVLSNFSVLHYNIRSFYANQTDLLSLASDLYPSIISLNELGTVIPQKTVQSLLFPYNIYRKDGTNTYGGVVLAIDKKLKSVPLNIDVPNVVAVLVIFNTKTYVVASIYSPPEEPLSTAIMSSLMSFSKDVIICEDFNAKHVDWQCPTTNRKGRMLADWLTNNNILEIHNPGLITSRRSDTTIDLIISSEAPTTVDCRTLP